MFLLKIFLKFLWKFSRKFLPETSSDTHPIFLAEFLPENSSKFFGNSFKSSSAKSPGSFIRSSSRNFSRNFSCFSFESFFGSSCARSPGSSGSSPGEYFWNFLRKPSGKPLREFNQKFLKQFHGDICKTPSGIFFTSSSSNSFR